MPATGHFAPEAALGGLEIQLPPYPRNRTQLGNRGMSEMCQKRKWSRPLCVPCLARRSSASDESRRAPRA
jgi:hypothetical protein